MLDRAFGLRQVNGVFRAPCLFAWMTALENVSIGVEQAFPKLSRTEQQNHHEPEPEAKPEAEEPSAVEAA